MVWIRRLEYEVSGCDLLLYWERPNEWTNDGRKYIGKECSFAEEWWRHQWYLQSCLAFLNIRPFSSQCRSLYLRWLHGHFHTNCMSVSGRTDVGGKSHFETNLILFKVQWVLKLRYFRNEFCSGIGCYASEISEFLQSRNIRCLRIGNTRS